MKKQIVLIGLVVLILEGALHRTAFAEETQKSIGTEAGEKARDAKDQIDAASKNLQASFNEAMRRMQEEWQKFLEAYNKPKT